MKTIHVLLRLVLDGAPVRPCRHTRTLTKAIQSDALVNAFKRTA